MSDSGDRSRERDRDFNRRSRTDSMRDRSQDRDRQPRSMKSSLNRVYVSNIPYEYRWQDIKDLFRNEVGDVQFVELFFDNNDKPKGSGIVEFADAASVKKCVEVMQRYEVKGRKLVIKEDIGVTRDRHGAIVSGGSRRGGGGGGGGGGDRFRDDHRRDSVSLRNDGNWDNTYGLSPQFLQSLNIEPPISNRVFVANLAYEVDKKKLKEVFRLAGKIIKVDIPLDKDGRIRGFAVVEYDHPVEAVQAISMFHNQVYLDRTMTVRLDRATERLPDGLRSVGMGLGPNGEPLKCVAHNLPSLTNNSQIGTLGGGVLGAVPNNLQLASALSGLGNVGALSGLNSQVLQAAGLTNNLLGSNMNNSDLSMVPNPLVGQNSVSQQAFSSLNAQNTSSNLSEANSFSRANAGGNDYSSYGTQSANQGYNGDSNSNRGYQSTYNASNEYSTAYPDSVVMRSSTGQDSKHFSRKVLISNLPSTASYKLLSEKFSEFGDVLSLEAKGGGSILVTFSTDWQAERAIKNLDKARVDGRMIDARLYF